MAEQQETAPKVVQDCHNMILWFIPKLDQFPRQRKFTLGQRIETALLEILRLLIEISYLKAAQGQINRQKAKLLSQVNLEVTLTRHLWRLAYKLGVISSKAYEIGSKQLVAIGRQIGGWQKTQSKPSEK